MCEQLIAALEQLPHRGGILRSSGTVFVDPLQCLLELGADALRPLLDVRRAGDFVGKCGIVGVRCQGHVHLAQTLPEQPVKGLQLVEGTELVLVHRYTAGDFVAYGAVEVVQRPDPGVTLAVEEVLDHHQRHRLALLVDPADLPEHAGNMGETAR